MNHVSINLKIERLKKKKGQIVKSKLTLPKWKCELTKMEM